MFVQKSPQKTLLDAEFLLPESKRKRLEKTWAGPFRDEILPILVEIEPEFAHKYHQTQGAPNKSVAVMLGLNILQDMFDFSDGETAEAFDFNVLWHVALETPPDQAHVCVKTIYNFRQILTTDEVAKKVFERATDRFIEKFNVRTTHHRLDSTHIFSNMAKLNRLGVFTKTIEPFLRKLKKKKPGAFEALPAPLRERYLERDGYFADVKGSKARRRLEKCAEDLHFLLERFRDSKTIKRLQAYKNMARLFEEQCEPQAPEKNDEDDDNKATPRVALKKPKDVAANSLQNPSDPDATFSGHKGQGYQAQIVETCHEENDFELITYVETEGAHESDQNAPGHVHENLIERGHAPRTAFVDPGYMSGNNIIEAETQGIDLHGPIVIGNKPSENKTPLSAFQFNAKRTRVEKCPAGHEPIKHKDCKDDKAAIAYFEKEVCGRCELKTTCRAKEQVAHRVLRFTSDDVAVARRRLEQETLEFKTAYKIRSGIEATNGHLKNERGLRRLRTRGSPSVSLRVMFKCLAENCHRVVSHVLKEVRKTQIAPVTT
jgi:transposase